MELRLASPERGLMDCTHRRGGVSTQLVGAQRTTLASRSVTAQDLKMRPPVRTAANLNRMFEERTANVAKFLYPSISAIAVFVVGVAAFAQGNQNIKQEQMKATVRSYFESMNEHETQKLIAMFSEDGAIEDPIGARLQTPTQFFTRLDRKSVV